jgi:AcrR family transcriptional regulator
MTERLSRQDRKSQTRERLLDAAAEVFARRGFEAATIDEVAAAAGYTKGAVYSNFESKTDLFLALIERRIEVQAAYQARRLEGAEDPRGAKDGKPGLREADVEWLVLATEFWLHAMRDRRAREALAEQYRRARAISASLIAAAYDKAGQQPPLPARDVALVVEGLATGLALQAALDPDAVDMELYREVLNRFLRLPFFSGEPVPSEPGAESAAGRAPA